MIIFGTRNRSTRVDNSVRYNCKHCDASNTVRAAKNFSYFHIFWIPIFPYSSEVVTECSHCKQVRFQEEIDREEVQNIKSTLNKKIPLGYYFGLIPLGIIFSIIVWSMMFNS